MIKKIDKVVLSLLVGMLTYAVSIYLFGITSASLIIALLCSVATFIGKPQKSVFATQKNAFATQLCCMENNTKNSLISLATNSTKTDKGIIVKDDVGYVHDFSFDKVKFENIRNYTISAKILGLSRLVLFTNDKDFNSLTDYLDMPVTVLSSESLFDMLKECGYPLDIPQKYFRRIRRQRQPFFTTKNAPKFLLSGILLLISARFSPLGAYPLISGVMLVGFAIISVLPKKRTQ